MSLRIRYHVKVSMVSIHLFIHNYSYVYSHIHNYIISLLNNCVKTYVNDPDGDY